MKNAFLQTIFVFYFLILRLPTSAPQCNVTLRRPPGKTRADSTSLSLWSELQQFWKSSHQFNDSSDLFHTDTPMSSFPFATNSLRISVCASWTCHEQCHSCILNTITMAHANKAATLAVLRHLKLSSIVFIFDETALTSTWNMTDFLTEAMPVAHISIRVDGEIGSLKRTLRTLMSDAAQHRYFLLLCKETTIQALLEEAVATGPNSGLLNRQHFWIIMSSIDENARLLRKLPPFANLLLLQSKLPACSTSMMNPHVVFKMASRAASTCITCNVECRDSIMRVFRDCLVAPKQINLIASHTDSEEVTHWQSVAVFSLSPFDLKVTSSLFPNKFDNFGGRWLRIATMPYVPFIIETNDTFIQDNLTCNRVQGALADVVDVLSEKLNFKPCYVYPPDKVFGSYDEKSGEVTGTVGMAYRQEVHLIATGLTVSHSRALFVDFSIPFWHAPFGILMRKEASVKYLFRFLHPFHWQVWLVLVCAVGLTGLAIWSFSKFSPCNREAKFSPVHFSTDMVQLKRDIWIAFSHILEQGQGDFASSVSNRLVIVCMWLFCLVMVNTYSASLFTFLALKDTRSPISGIEDLMGQNEIRLLLRENFLFSIIFDNSTDKVIHRLYRNAVKDNNMTKSEIIDMIRNSEGGKWAFISEYFYLLSLQAMDCKNLAVVQEISIQDSITALAWPKNSYFAEKINFLLQEMIQNGYIEKLIRKWDRSGSKNICKVSSVSTDFAAVDISELLGIFTLFGIFLGASAACLVLEIVLKKRNAVLCSDLL